jgi:hypothetical protein
MNLFGALDLVLVGVLKKLKQTPFGDGDDETTMNRQISRLIQADEQSATSLTIMRSARKAGLSQDIRVRPFRWQFGDTVLMDSPGFKAMCDRHSPIEGYRGPNERIGSESSM